MRLLLLLLFWFAIHSTRAASEIPIKIYTEELLFLQIKAGNEATGFAVEVLRKTLEQAGLSGKIQFYPWARAYRMVQSQPNSLLFSTRRTQFRESKFIWATPLFPEGYDAWYSALDLALICSENFTTEITSLEQAKQYTLVGQRGDYLAEFARHELEWPKSNITFTTQYSDTLSLLQKRRADFLLLGKGAVAEVTSQLKIKNHSFKVCFELKANHAQYYFAFNLKTNKEIVSRFRRGFDALQASGEYQKLYQVWEEIANKARQE